MATDCDRFEVEIGMLQHGALDADEERLLRAHLEGCGGCRRFALDGGDLEAALELRATEDVARVDFAALHDRVRRWQRRRRRALWLAPLFLLQLPLSFLAATGHLPPRELLLVAPPVTVALYLGYVWLVGRPFREVCAVATRSDDLVAGYVRELGRQRRRARVLGVVAAALAYACLAAAFAEGETRVLVYALGCALFFGAFAGYELGIALPSLRAALDEVER